MAIGAACQLLSQQPPACWFPACQAAAPVPDLSAWC